MSGYTTDQGLKLMVAQSSLATKIWAGPVKFAWVSGETVSEKIIPIKNINKNISIQRNLFQITSCLG